MRTFDGYNPMATAVYFLVTAGIAMFCMNPVILALSLAGALTLYFVRSGLRNYKSHFGFLALFLVMAALNPLFSHNGATVIFVLNNNPVTLEAVIYGFAAAGMVCAVLYWFRSFTEIMTSDKLLYIFGKLSPKLALILSMGLRYVPLLSSQAKKINQSQTALGLYKDDNIIDRTKGGLRVFSVLVTWALENGIITADSMTARGYGIGRRSHFSVFRMSLSDTLLLITALFLGALTFVSMGAGALEFDYYPVIKAAEFTPLSAVGYVSYGILCMLPAIIEAEEKIKWKYYRSKI